MLFCIKLEPPRSLLFKTFQNYTNVITHKQVSKVKMCGNVQHWFQFNALQRNINRSLFLAFFVCFLHSLFKRAHFNSIRVIESCWTWIASERKKIFIWYIFRIFHFVTYEFKNQHKCIFDIELAQIRTRSCWFMTVYASLCVYTIHTNTFSIHVFPNIPSKYWF